jgi:hypothetical protein
MSPTLRRAGPRLGRTQGGAVVHLFAADLDAPLCRRRADAPDIDNIWWSEWEWDHADLLCRSCEKYALGVAVLALQALGLADLAAWVHRSLESTYPPDTESTSPAFTQEGEPK